MLILILIDVQYLQNVAFSFEKGLNGQMYFFLDSNFPIKKYPLPAKFPIPLVGEWELFGRIFKIWKILGGELEIDGLTANVGCIFYNYRLLSNLQCSC